MATKKSTTKKKTTKRKKKHEGDPGSRGLEAVELAEGKPPALVAELARTVEADGGKVLAGFRDPVGGNWQLLVGLPLSQVTPTPFQRDLSDTHVAKLTEVLHRLDRFLDPLVAVRGQDGGYWTPNGYHRLAALQRLGARSVVALLVPEEQLAYQILSLNTERAHNLKERALEVIRMAKLLATVDPRAEQDFADEFEMAGLLTLGVCYEERPRFSGGAYQSLLKRIDEFQAEKLPKALEIRARRAGKVMELEDAVAEVVAAFKKRGIDSSSVRGFVIAHINPLHGDRSKKKADFDGTIKKMLAAAQSFDVDAVRPEELAKLGGGFSAEE
jgi:ParB family chromosome partitioning protein